MLPFCETLSMFAALLFGPPVAVLEALCVTMSGYLLIRYR
jgi:hypothetical protein